MNKITYGRVLVGSAAMLGLCVPVLTGCTDAGLDAFLTDLAASLNVNVTIDDNRNAGGNGSDDAVGSDNSNSSSDGGDATNGGSTDGGTVDGSGSGGSDGTETRYIAPLTGGGSASSRAEWRVRTDRVEFKVEVESGAPGATLDIVVDGILIGSLTLDSLGFGEIEYQDPPDDNPAANEFVLPDTFPPDVGDGSAVSVGELSGVLVLM